jgi:ferritin-like metal-binding protein YciE
MSIGFAPRTENELEQLRSAYKSLNDVTRNLANLAKCVKNQDLRMAEHHLRAAEWHLGQAKQVITVVGQAIRKPA